MEEIDTMIKEEQDEILDNQSKVCGNKDRKEFQIDIIEQVNKNAHDEKNQGVQCQEKEPNPFVDCFFCMEIYGSQVIFQNILYHGLKCPKNPENSKLKDIEYKLVPYFKPKSSKNIFDFMDKLEKIRRIIKIKENIREIDRILRLTQSR